MEKQHRLILATAQEMGITVNDLSLITGCDTAGLSKNGRRELLLKGTPTSLISLRSQYYCDNKQLTKGVYDALDIPSPGSIEFNDPRAPQVAAFFEKGKSYVCKPVDGTNGVGVSLHIDSLEAIERYWQKYSSLGNTFMLEEQVEGTDLRIQVIGGQIVAACTRVPAFVVGDGQQSLEALAEQLKIRTRKQNPANDLVLEENTFELLQKQGVALGDILLEGQRIYLKKVANMAQGAIAVDLTDELHPEFNNWIKRLVEYLGTTYFAIDIMAVDHRKYPDKEAWVIEINARPEWLHHTFSDRKQHDISRILLKDLFG